MLDWIGRRWSWLRHHFDLLLASGFVLASGGVAAIIFGASDPVKVIGGALLGAGSSIIVTTFTSQRAIHEQYAKDANLRRKDEVYGPLHAEITELRHQFDSSREGNTPYPRAITIGSKQSYLPDTAPTLARWVEFKASYRASDFSESSRKLLDEVNEAADGFNRARATLEGVAIDILAQHINNAIATIEHSDDYAVWTKKQESKRQRNVPLGHEPDPEHDWYERLEWPGTPKAERGRQWAKSLVTGDYPALNSPETLSWLLAGDTGKISNAAQVAQQKLGGGSPASIPLEWIADFMRAFLQDLRAATAYQELRAAEQKLYALLVEAQTRLVDALHEIQNRFEGGPPLL